jgi:hypothetical protein
MDKGFAWLDVCRLMAKKGALSAQAFKSPGWLSYLPRMQPVHRGRVYLIHCADEAVRVGDFRIFFM